MPIDDITKTGRQTYRDLQNQNNESMSGASGNSGSLRLMLNKQLSPVEYVPFNEIGDFGHSRYDRGENGVPSWALNNLEDWRGQNQSAAEQWVHGITKGAGLAATTFLDGTLGLLYGIGQGVVEGRASALWDNDLSNALQDLNQKMEKWLPNYRTQEEQERNWWQNAGTANFWADGFLKNLGFTVGAFYSGNAWLKGLKAMNWVKNAASAQAVGSLLSGFNEGRIEANNAQRDFLTLQNQLISDAREKRAMEIAANPYDSDEVKIQKLKTLDDNVKLQQDNALQRAHQMGMATLIGNTLILTADNMWQFGKLYSRGFTNAKGIMGRIEDGIMKQGIRGGIKEGGKYVAETVSKPRAILRGFSNAASEGFEELNQAAIAEGTGYWRGVDSPDAYYEALKDPKAQLQTKGFFEALGTGLTNTYGNGDRWEEFAIGFLTGAIGMPTFGSVNNADANTWLGRGRRFGISGGIVGEYRNQMQQSRENEESARVMNAYLDKLATNANYFSQSQSFTNAMDGFAASNNKFEYENMSNNDDFAAISRFAKAGRLDDLKELVNQDFENMSDEQLTDIAVNTTPNIIRKDDGTIAYEDINGNVATGGWRDATGKLMSETPEGREQMREDLKAKRDKILYEIGEYEKSVEAVRAISNNSLPDDQVNELAWLDWKGKMFNNRYEQIQKKQEENLTGMLNAAQKYSDRAARDIETYDSMVNAVKSEIDKVSKDIKDTKTTIETLRNNLKNSNDSQASALTGAAIRMHRNHIISQEERLVKLQDSYDNFAKNANKEKELEFGKYLQSIADEMTKFLSYIKGSTNPLQLASKIEANEKFISWAEDGVMKELLTNEMGITGEEYDRIMQDLKDTAMIAKTAKQFKERYDEFSKNPAKLVANRGKIDKAKEKVNNIIDKQRTRKKVDNTPVSELVKGAINGDIDFDALESTLGESNDNINKAREIVNIANQYRKEVSESDMNDITKGVAFNALDAALESIEDPKDFPSAIEFNNLDPEFYRNNGVAENMIPITMSELSEATKDFDSLISAVEDGPKVSEQKPEVNAKAPLNSETGADPVPSNISVQDLKKAQEESTKEYESTPEFQANRDSQMIAELAFDKIDRTGHMALTEDEKASEIKDIKALLKVILDAHKEGKSHDEVMDMLNQLLEAPNTFDIIQESEDHIKDYIDNLYSKTASVETVKKEEQPTQPIIETHQTTNNESIVYNTSAKSSLEASEKPKKEYYKPQQSLLPFPDKRVEYDFTPYYQIIEIIDKANEEGLSTLSDAERSIYNKYHAIFRYSPQYRKHIIAVGKFLNDVGALSYVGNGNVQLNDTIEFTVSKKLQDDPDVQDTIVLMTKNGQIVGSLPSLKFDRETIQDTPGLEAFIKEAISQWNKSGKITMQSKVNKYMIGQLPFTEERHTLNEVYGNEPFNIGISFNGGTESIKSNPGVTADAEPSPMELHTMLPLGASKGQPFLLFETKDKSLRRSYIPVPFLMPVLGASTANSALGRAVKAQLESLTKDNMIDVKNALNELLSLQELHINYLDNGNIKIDILKHGETGQKTIYSGPTTNLSAAFNELLKYSVPFQISRRYMNTQYADGQDYNRMIGELANINLGIGNTHTVSNWFTINPIGADGKMIEGVAPRTTKTNPNAHGGTSVNWNGQEYSCNIGHQKVYDNHGKEYNGADKLELLAFAEAQQKEMTKPFVSRFCSQDQLFDPNTGKFIPKPTTTNDVITSFNAGLQVPNNVYSSAEELLEKVEDRDAYRYLKQLEAEESKHGQEGNRKGYKQIRKAVQMLSDAKTIRDMAAAINMFDVNVYHGAEATEEETTLFNNARQRLANSGYEIVNLLGQDYNEGMKVSAEFVMDETLPKGTRRITGVRTPQINKDGVMVQSASIVVRENPDTEETPKIPIEVEEEKMPDVKGTYIKYTPKGKKTQEYYVDENNRIFNKDGKEVFSNDSVDRTKILTNLAVKQGRAKVVTYQGSKYIVNWDGEIISGATGKVMKWPTNNGNRKSILALAQTIVNENGKVTQRFGQPVRESQPETTNVSRGEELLKDEPISSSSRPTATVLDENNSLEALLNDIASQSNEPQNVSTSLDTMDDALLDAEAEPYIESDNNFALAWTFLNTEQKRAFLNLDSPTRSAIKVELGKLVNKKITRDTPKSEYFFASQKRINQLVGLSTISSSQETSQEDLRKKARDRGVIFRDARHQKVWEALTPEQQAKFANLSEYKGGQVWDRLLGSYDNSKGFDTNKLGGSVDDVLDRKVKFRVTDEQKVEPFNLEHEKAWMRRVLPQFSDEEHLKIIDGLTKMGTNTEVYGMFIDGIILLNGTTQTRGTAYHEAFHAVFDTLLTDEERENVYKAGRQKFHKVGVDLEEALAEDFRKYTQGIEYNDTKSGLAKVWRKLTSWIKRLFGYNRILNQLYADINNGLYADRIPKVTDAIRMFDKELEDIKAKAIANGTFMKAPNGNPTNLKERQWLQVRTKAFKDWFGDWINDPANASKVVDKNGEPLVVYHGSRESFNTFRLDTKNRGNLTNIIKKGIYFSNERVAKQYASSKEKEDFFRLQEYEEAGYDFEEIAQAFGFNPREESELEAASKYLMGLEKSYGKFRNNLYAVFLNIRRPIEYDLKGEYIGSLTKEQKDNINSSEGAILYNVDETTGRYRGDVTIQKMFVGTDYIVFNPNQIKSATDNIGSFSEDSNDIRYREVTKEEYQRLADFNKILKVIKDKTSKAIDVETRDVQYHVHMTNAHFVRERIKEAVKKILPKASIEITVFDNDTYAHIDTFKVNGYSFFDELELLTNMSNYERNKTDEQKISEQALIDQGDTFDFGIKYREIPNSAKETGEKLAKVESALFNASSRPREFIQERRILTEERDNLRYQMRQLLRGVEYKEWLSNFDNLSEQDQRAILNYGLTKETWEELNDEGRENALLCFGSF